MKPTAHNHIQLAITSNEFRKAVEADPAWASKLTEPVEITDFCDMTGSIISHLSPLLHFKGRDEEGICARFWDCKSLKVAEGTFHGMVHFCDSGVRQIGDLKITDTSSTGDAASFYQCTNLKIAEGNFPGFVEFAESGVEKIGNLVIVRPNGNGHAASFACCFSLKVAEGTFPGKVNFSYAALEKIGNLRTVLPSGEEILALADFSGCEKVEDPTDW